MKNTGMTILALVLFAWAGAAAGAAPATKEADRLAALVRTIEQEDNPTLITAAYARGMEAFPKNARLHEAYLRRMIELGHLALAYQPAGLLAKLDPKHALAWAVVAHMHAGRDEYVQALAAAVTAARHGPDHPFVLNVTGQMVAWYDHKAEKEKIPEAVRQSLADMREDLDKRDGFTQAYKAAKAFLEGAPAGQQEQAGERVFVPEHLKEPDEAVGDRARRVRELIEELERRRETDRPYVELRTSSVYLGDYYVPYYAYYPYGVFGFGHFGHFGHWRIIFGHGLFHGRHHHDGHHHGHHHGAHGGSSLVVTVHNQKHLFGKLVVGSHRGGPIFGRRASKPRIRESIGTVGRRRASRRSARGATRTPSITTRMISPGSRTIGRASRVISPRSRTIGRASRVISPRSRTTAFGGRGRSIRRSSGSVRMGGGRSSGRGALGRRR